MNKCINTVNGCCINLNRLRGVTGASGMSAYQIALNNGFVGTEVEWLNSLKGATGANGLAATIKVDTSTRVPFDDNPYVVNVGTPENAILKFGIPAGEPGPIGPKGEPGGTGPTGPKGEKGESSLLKGLQLQLLNPGDSEMPPNSIMKFDDTITNDSTIDYNASTGEFTINEPGNYFISWWMSIDYGGSSEVSVMVNDEPYSVTILSGATQYSKVTGQAFISIQSAPAIVSLKNTGIGPIGYTTADRIKADIIILELS